jgi:hypothetical protein
MRKPLLFYVFHEHTDHDKYCKRIGMIPYDFKEIDMYGTTIKLVKKYLYKGFLYIVLEGDECYSGYMTILMRLPKLSFMELLDTALTSRKQGERDGAIGVILKDYPNEFKQYFSSIQAMDIEDLINNNVIKRIVKTIIILIRNNISSHMRQLETILTICEEIQSRLESYKQRKH